MQLIIDFLHWFLDVFLHLDEHLGEWAARMGGWLYAVLFAIVFCETGLVVTPLLPGDSLLFAAGALCSLEGSPLQVGPLIVLLLIAAVLGDTVNYHIGKFIGPKVFYRESSWLLNKKHLLKAQAFYEKHGGKAIILARFVPIVRTFAPFVAGVGVMSYPHFLAYNVIGGAVWVSSLTLLGFWFGNQPLVKENFETVILAIIAISLLPIFVEYGRDRLKARGQSRGGSSEA